jgi:hypothetical protein
MVTLTTRTKHDNLQPRHLGPPHALSITSRSRRSHTCGAHAVNCSHHTLMHAFAQPIGPSSNVVSRQSSETWHARCHMGSFRSTNDRLTFTLHVIRVRSR